jgi:cell division protein FtsZ
VLELPSEDAVPEDEDEGFVAPATEPEPAFAADTAEDGDDALDLGGMPEAGDDEEEYDEDYEDVDGIVDPLAGLRNDGSGDSDGAMAEPADDSAHAVVGEHKGYADEDEDEVDDWGEPPAQVSTKEPLELTDDAAEDADDEGPRAAQDELLLDADRLAAQDSPLQTKTGRRRGLVSGGGGASNAGSTLFERMANLSRGTQADDEDEDGEEGDEEGGSSLSIPRFLGRQNNQ